MFASPTGVPKFSLKPDDFGKDAGAKAASTFWEG